MHVFGSFGILFLICATFTGLFTVHGILLEGFTSKYGNLGILTVFLVFVSLNLFVSGLKIDLLFRNFYRSSEKKKYEVEKRIGVSE